MSVVFIDVLEYLQFPHWVSAQSPNHWYYIAPGCYWVAFLISDVQSESFVFDTQKIYALATADPNSAYHLPFPLSIESQEISLVIDPSKGQTFQKQRPNGILLARPVYGPGLSQAPPPGTPTVLHYADSTDTVYFEPVRSQIALTVNNVVEDLPPPP